MRRERHDQRELEKWRIGDWPINKGRPEKTFSGLLKFSNPPNLYSGGISLKA
jgi:hypothetical protein